MTTDRRQGDSGMSVEELYNWRIGPQLEAMTEAMQKLEKSNTEQHEALGEKVAVVHNRVFTTNGEPALTVVAKQHTEDIKELQKIAHEPTMGKRRYAEDSVKVGSGVGLAGMVYGLFKLTIAKLTEGDIPL